MTLRSIPLAEFDNRYGIARKKHVFKDKVVKAAAQKYHTKIVQMIHSGHNIGDIHREITRLGYNRTYATLHDYIRRYIDTKPAKYHNNQYTLSNRCAKGHEWVDFRWEHNQDTDRSYRRCKICERERLRK